MSWLEPAWTIQSLHPKEQCTLTDQTTAQVDLFFPRYVFKRSCLFATKSLIMKDGDMINYNKALKGRILPKPDKTLLRNYLELSVRWQRIHLFLEQTVRTPRNYFDFTSLLYHWLKRMSVYQPPKTQWYYCKFKLLYRCHKRKNQNSSEHWIWPESREANLANKPFLTITCHYKNKHDKKCPLCLEFFLSCHWKHLHIRKWDFRSNS